jgi:predicted nuclease with TOPRIM domain
MFVIEEKYLNWSQNSKQKQRLLKKELKLKKQQIEDIESKIIEPIILEKNELQKQFVEVKDKYEGLSLHLKSLEKENNSLKQDLNAQAFKTKSYEDLRAQSLSLSLLYLSSHLVERDL